MSEIFRVEGIAEKQIEQLISYANSDSLVRLYTSDGQRFQVLKNSRDGRIRGEVFTPCLIPKAT